MKISGLLSLVLATAAFILSFLCIFAGNKPGVMTTPNYSIVSVNTSQIAENIVRQVVDQYLDDPEKLLGLLNGLFANVIGQTLKGNTTGIQSILGGSGITLPKGILPSGVSIPTSISIPTSGINIASILPTSNILGGLTSFLKERDALPTPAPNLVQRDANPTAAAAAVALAQRTAVPIAVADLEERDASPAADVPSQAELIARNPYEDDLIARLTSEDLQKRDIISDILGAIPGGSSTFKNFSLADLPIAQELANKIIKEFANKIGIYDFYDFHILKYCLGNYYPTDKANATVPLSAIHRNVTQCPSYNNLNLKGSVNKLLNQSGFAGQNVSLTSINFPTNLDSYINLAKSLLKALTALYAVTIGMVFFIMILSIISLFKHGREVLVGTCMWIFALLGLLCSLVASIIVTVAAHLIGSKINDLGNQLGLSYTIGAGFEGFTWAAFACMFIITLLTCFVCCSGRRSKRRDRRASKAAQFEKSEQARHSTVA